MKAAVVYKSFLGTTKQYALWISQALQAELLTFRQASKRKLTEFDTVVILSGTYVGHMPLVGFLKSRWLSLKDRHVIVAAVGIEPPDSPASIRSYEEIPESIRTAITYLKLPGKLGEENPAAPVKPENIEPVLAAARSHSKSDRA